MTTTATSYDDLQKLADDPTKLKLVLGMDRIGGNLFLVKLEYENYPPRTKSNDDFQLIIVNWPFEDGKAIMHWCVVAIPMMDRPKAEAVAAYAGLRIADGIPMMTTRNKTGLYIPSVPEVQWEQFPCNSSTTFTLEYEKDHSAYKNNPQVDQATEFAHRYEIKMIFEEDQRKFRRELVLSGATPEEVESQLQHAYGPDYNPDLGLPAE